MINFDEKDFEYFDYIQEHKRNVLKAFNMLVDKTDVINSLSVKEAKTLRQRALDHDLSKYSKQQFDLYCDKFFRKIECDFNSAWEHHYRNELHHPEKYKENKKEMELLDILEMIIDWHAMSIKFNNSSLEYFLNKKEELKNNFNFLENNFELIEDILKSLNKQVN